MLAKKTSKNQITLPKKIVDKFPGVDYFDVREEKGQILLFPVRPGRADQVREKLAELGIVAEDVTAAIEWARRK
jgi:hypothetical protein